MTKALEFLQFQVDGLTEVRDGKATGLKWVDEDGQTITETLLPSGVPPNMEMELHVAEEVAKIRLYHGALVAENMLPLEAQARLDQIQDTVAKLAFEAVK